MPKPQPRTLLCTVGTSLFYPNLASLAREPQSGPALAVLARAYTEKNWCEVAAGLHHMTPTERLFGAEINSVAALLTDGKDYLELSDDRSDFSRDLPVSFPAEQGHPPAAPGNPA